MRKIKQNSKGFSLVALIAAVAILAVVVTPLLHSFVTSTNISRKATIISEATLAGKNILEAIDARGISELQEISDTNSFCNLLSTEDNQVSVTPIGDFDSRGNLKSDDGNFTIGIQNVKAGKSVYDAKVEFTRGDKEENQKDQYGNVLIDSNGDPQKSTSFGLYTINSKKLAKYSAMDGVFCQPYIRTANPDYMVEEVFQTRAKSNKRIDVENYTRSRTIQLITYQDKDGYVWATLTYFYEFEYNLLDLDGYTVYGYDGEPVTDTISGRYDSNFRYSYSLFPGGFYPTNKDGSVSIYLMYYPDYDSEKNLYREDNFEVLKVARDGDEWSDPLFEVDLNLFLYKQKPIDYDEENQKYISKGFTDVSNGYKATITMNMPSDFEIDTNDEETEKETLIYTNINQDMINPAADFVFQVRAIDYSEFSPEDAEEFSYFPAWQNPAYAETFYLVRQEADVRIYKVKITLYPSGTFKKALSVLASTDTEPKKYTFPVDDIPEDTELYIKTVIDGEERFEPVGNSSEIILESDIEYYALPNSTKSTAGSYFENDPYTDGSFNPDEDKDSKVYIVEGSKTP
jgi:type II secretory pathway pseudopilin PulG